MFFWLSAVLAAVATSMSPSDEVVAHRLTVDVDDLEPVLSEAALDQFHADLLSRLLEAGHVIGRGGATELRVAAVDDRVELTCTIAEQVDRIDISTTDEAVLGLELVHRAVELADRCAAPAGDVPDGVVIDDSELSVGERSELAVTLAEHALSLVGSEEHASWRVCVSTDSAGAVLVPVDERCDPTMPEEQLAPDLATAIARWQVEDKPTSASSTARPGPDGDAATAPPVSRPKPRPRQPWTQSVAAATGLRLRLPGSGPTIRLDAMNVSRRGLSLGLTGQLSPSRVDSLVVFDTLALAHAGWRVPVTSTMKVQLRLAAGVSIHRSTFPREPVDYVVVPALQVPIDMLVRLTKRGYLTVGVAGTWTTRAVEHEVNTTTVWQRGAVQIDVLLGVGVDWARRGGRRQ